MAVLYWAHPTKRLFDALVIVPVDVIVDKGKHLVTVAFLPMPGGGPPPSSYARRAPPQTRFRGRFEDVFIGMFDGYMVWHRGKRIKTEFSMSIMDRRHRLGLVA